MVLNKSKSEKSINDIDHSAYQQNVKKTNLKSKINLEDYLIILTFQINSLKNIS